MDLFLARQRGCPATETVQEYRVRDDLARQVGGLTEAHLPLGFADVLTAQAVFEVEPRHTWQEGARQVLAYSAQCGIPPGLALFRAIPAAEMLAIFTELRAVALHGLHSDGIELWYWTGKAWQQITSPALCANMPIGAVFGPCAYCGRRVTWINDSTICDGYEPTRPIGEMHCCPELCLTTHENEKELLLLGGPARIPCAVTACGPRPALPVSATAPAYTSPLRARQPNPPAVDDGQ